MDPAAAATAAAATQQRQQQSRMKHCAAAIEGTAACLAVERLPTPPGRGDCRVSNGTTSKIQGLSRNKWPVSAALWGDVGNAGRSFVRFVAAQSIVEA